jgi:hypothetical protein
MGSWACWGPLTGVCAGDECCIGYRRIAYGYDPSTDTCTLCLLAFFFPSDASPRM